MSLFFVKTKIKCTFDYFTINESKLNQKFAKRKVLSFVQRTPMEERIYSKGIPLGREVFFNKQKNIMYQTRKIDAVKSIQEGFRIAGMNWGLFIGFTVLLFVVSSILGMIPYVNQVITTFLNPILGLGVGIVAHKMATGQNLSFNNYFDGFQKWQPLVLLTLLKILITIIFAAPLLYLCLEALGGIENLRILADNSRPSDTEFATEKFEIMKTAWKSMNGWLIFGAFILAMIPFVIFMFSEMLVWFKNAEPVNALTESANIVKDNIGQVLVWFVLTFFIVLISALPCGLGLLFTIPALGCATYAAFASVVDIDNRGEMKTVDHLISE